MEKDPEDPVDLTRNKHYPYFYDFFFLIQKYII